MPVQTPPSVESAEKKIESTEQTAAQPADASASGDVPAASGTPVRNKYAQYERMRKRKMSGKIRAIIAVAALLAVGFGSYYFINHLLKEDPAQGEVMTGFAFRGPLASYITGWGSATPKDKAEIGKKTIGTVTEVLVQPGDLVKIGDPLFVVDPAEARKDLDAALTEQARALDDLNKAQEDISNLSVYAPFSGRLIEAADIKTGSPVASEAELGRLVDDSKMKLALYFSYGYFNEIRPGMPATISVPKSMSSLSGQVESVENIRKVNEDGTVCFRVNLIMSNPGALTEKMEATAIIHGDSDMAPYDMGELEFSREEKIYAKVSGDCVSTNIHQYYEYRSGDLLLTMKNGSLGTTLTSAQRAYDSATEKVIELNDGLAESSPVSPIDGQVMAVMVNVGDELSASGTAVVTIADMSKMIIDTTIDEMDISKVSIGMPVSVTFDQTDGVVYLDGVIQTISFEAQVNQNGGGVAYFPATIALDNPGTLLPGMGVQYNINAVLLDDCVMVPASAIIYTESGPAVYVREDTVGQYAQIIDLPAEMLPEGFIAVPVEIGISDEMNVEIRGGIEEGTEVYLQQATHQNYGGGMGIISF